MRKVTSLTTPSRFASHPFSKPPCPFSPLPSSCGLPQSATFSSERRRNFSFSAFLLPAFLLFCFSTAFAQTDYFYSSKGEMSSFKIRKDKVLIKCHPEADRNALVEQPCFISADQFDDNFIIATIDTLETSLNILQQMSSIVDITYALEYKDGTLQFPVNEVVVKMKSGHSVEEVFEYAGLGKQIEKIVLCNQRKEIYEVTLNISLQDILPICRKLYETGFCEIASPSFVMHLAKHCVPQPETNPHFPYQWGLENTGQLGYWSVPGIDINVKPAWCVTKGNSIKVAVLDEGVQLNHPDLMNNLLLGYDAVTNGPGGTNGSNWGVDNDHGTICAGIIGALDNNIGIIGVAPECKIIPIRVGYTPAKGRSDIPPGVPNNGKIWRTDDKWTADGIRKAWEEFDADVISCSWGGGNPESYHRTQAAIEEAVTQGRNGKGCVMVFSSGNSGSSVQWPANLQYVTAVGAIWDGGDEYRWIESNYHCESLDVVAPGMNIYTTIPDDSYGFFHGTSTACPFVSGVAALILSVNPCLKQEDVRKIIALSCNKITPVYEDNGYDVYKYGYSQFHEFGTWNYELGYGLVDAYKAVMYAKSHEQIKTSVETGVNEGVPSSPLTFEIENEYRVVEYCTGWAANPLAWGIYEVKRHEIRATVGYDKILYPEIEGIANGFSSANNPNNGEYFMETVDVSETSATVRTYVYEVLQHLDGEPPPANGWIPTHPDDVRFHIIVKPGNLQHKLLLQNQTENGTKNYNVITNMLAGNNVNPAEPTGDYTIQSRGQVSVHAGESVILSNGFTAISGSYFHAYVEPFFTCIHSGTTTGRGGNEEQIPVIQDYSVEKTEFMNMDDKMYDKEFYLKLYPNPANHNVTIEYNLIKSEVVEITLNDNFGKPVYILKNKTPHDSGVYKITLSGVELPAGIYYCTLKTENYQKTEKLMMVR